MSSLERAIACPPSQVYPHAGDAGGPWAQRGTAIHKFLQEAVTLGRDEALERVPPDFRAACEVIEFEALPPATGGFACEVALGYDIDTETSRELGRGLSREEAYALATPRELVGTLDLVGLTPDSVVVYDYKTGHTHFDSVERNWQLIGYALAAARAYERTHAFIAIIRIPEHGEPFFIPAELDAQQLTAAAAALRELDLEIEDLKMRVLAGEPLRPVTGDHCGYCPAIASCPAMTGLARAMTSAEGLVLPELDVESAPKYLEALKRGEQVLKRIRLLLETFAVHTPVPLGDGWWYGPRPWPKDHISVGMAVPIIERVLENREAALAAVKTIRCITKESLELAIKGMKVATPGLKVAPLKRKVLAALEDAGALTRTFTQPVGEHRPKVPKEAEEGPPELPAETEGASP